VAVPLAPARLRFTQQGVPYSETFDDVYHSAAGGPAQARQVFLRGNELPQRWRGRPRFVILETGFGAGINFLATWQAWRRDPARCARLHFVSIEKHPFAAADAKSIFSNLPEIRDEAAELEARWPTLVPGAQRIELDGGAVVLTLFFADIKVARDLRRPAPPRRPGALQRACATRSKRPALPWRSGRASARRRKCSSPTTPEPDESLRLRKRSVQRW
jgi:tRNA 5-methylaminomethyl-2-thiouridine biosynthesis bifunctional protein